MKLTGNNIIGPSLTGNKENTFAAMDPSSGNKLKPDFSEAKADEINRAVQQAADSFDEYRKIPAEKKAGFLDAIADEIMALGDVLIERCMLETGLPEGRLHGERNRTVNQLKLFADVVREGSWVEARIETAQPDREPVPKPDIRSMLKALGPVGVFGASNFPLAFSVAGGDTASALAAGCTVVIKAHPSHPGTCELVGRAIQQAIQKTGMPEGTFSMVHGRSNDVGMGIVRHPDIKAIGFTGSFRGGKALFDATGQRPEPIPVYAEMGSTNPIFILPNALKQRKESISKELAGSVSLGVGQFCTNPGLVFIQQSEEGNAFQKLLADSIKKVPAGTMLNSGIRDNYVAGIKKLREIQKVEIAAKGMENGHGVMATAYLLQAPVSTFFENPQLEKEVFGPSTLALSASDKSELMKAASKLEGHLTATIHGTEEDLDEYSELIDILEQKVGRLIFNGYPTGVEVCHAMVHGGPYPATTDSRTTSVGTMAMNRFARPVSYQGFPQSALPDELKDANPLKIWRLVDGKRTNAS